MSIFRDTFQPEIKQSLEFRQRAMTNRTPQVIQYMNSRNTWIRMTSTVDVNESNLLASQYVLQGGTLNSDKTLKSGIGDNNTYAYSTVSPGGKLHRLGIRPMPGITSLDVKSKSAYGSLREATVKFQCWDITQLEDLELLYMRPGYTVLVEWGWVPYFDESEVYRPTFTDFYSNKILNPTTYNVTDILDALYKKSVKAGGNYDALYGYVKNYEWSAREDGGYDCSVTIISIGEMIESLKVNYVRSDLDKLYKKESTGIGFLDDLFAVQGNTLSIQLADYYQKNTLAGIWAELNFKLKDTAIKVDQITSDLIKNKWYIAQFPGLENYGDFDKFIQPGSSYKAYITLEAAFNIINKYVLTVAQPGNVPLVSLSTKAETYSGKGGGNLLCVAHPLQVSIDPTVCLIKNPLWYDEIAPAISGSAADISTTATLTTNVGNQVSVTGARKGIIMGDSLSPSIHANSQKLERNIKETEGVLWESGITLVKLKEFIEKYPGDGTVTDIFISIGTNDTYIEFKNAPINGFVSLLKTKFPNAKIYIIKGLYGYAGITDNGRDYYGQTITSILPRIEEYYKKWTNLGVTALSNSVGQVFAHPDSGTPSIKTIGAEIDNIMAGVVSPSTSPTTSTSTQEITTFSVNDAIASINQLKDLKKDFFFENNPGKELGVIGEIYVSLDFLYRQSLSPSLESGDSKEKNEIDLHKYIKSIASGIQVAIGNINSFEVHVDPIDNIARIIDINYAVPIKPSNLFILKLQNTNSIVRSSKIQSQIFPNQSALITMGSQPRRGVLGSQNNTLVDFNNGLLDRIIKDKEDPKQNSLLRNNAKTPNLAVNVANIIILLGILGRKVPEGALNNINIGELVSKAKNSLRDIIVYFQSLPDIASPGRNRGVLPLKYSFTMDGIGGLVIGSLFKVESQFIPKGYKGDENIGTELVQTISGLSHNISNGDWSTTIEALNVLINRPDIGNFNDYKATVKKNIEEAIKVIVAAGAGIPSISTLGSIIGNIGAASGNTVTTGGNISGNYIPFEKLKPTTQAAVSSGLVLVREGATATRTIGTMWYKGKVLGFTIEDALRTTKVDKQTGIPPVKNGGSITYNVSLGDTGKASLYDSRVKFPEAKGVFKNPGVFPRVGTSSDTISLSADGLSFAGIRIHRGQTESSSEGCIIYSSKRNEDGSVVRDLSHNEALTRLIFQDNINKLTIINEF